MSDDYAQNLFNSLLSKPIEKTVYPDHGCLDYEIDDEYNFTRALDQIRSDFPEVQVVVIDYQDVDERAFLSKVKDDMALNKQTVAT
jgi:hypothetical protein